MTHMAKHIFTLLYLLPVYECLHRDLYSPTHTYKKKKKMTGKLFLLGHRIASKLQGLVCCQLFLDKLSC